MGRHSEYACDLVDLELAGFQKLGLLGWDADTLELHPFLEHGDAVGVTAALVGGIPALFYALGVFIDAGVLQYAARLGAVGEDGAP